jgi:hypothetical protein
MFLLFLKFLFHIDVQIIYTFIKKVELADCVAVKVFNKFQLVRFFLKAYQLN